MRISTGSSPSFDRCAAIIAIATAVIALASCDDESAHTTVPAAQPAPQSAAEVRSAAAIPVAGHDFPVTSGAAPGYVQDSLCAECHAEIARTYQHVGMARSFHRPNPDNIIEDLEDNHFFHEPSNRHYEMTERGGEFFLTRYRLNDRGERVHEFEQRIDWIIGSGSHSRGYLHQTDRGELFQLPLVWYTQSQSWGMAPGYDNAHHDDFTRQIARDCMFCHNAYPDVPAGSDAFGQPHVYPHNLPEGTGCQRCHGPGAQHMRIANDPQSTLASVRDSIVNPARLEPQRRDDVCMQCHLQPTSALSSFARRFGEHDYAYRPGQPLHQHLLHFDFGDPADRAHSFEINHHPYRLRQSRCFIASEGALNCITCHDPHRKVPLEERAAHYRNACFTCHSADDCGVDSTHHATAHTAADYCVSCHMPPRRTQDVVQIVMTDHLIRRHPPAGDELLAALEETPSPQGLDVTFLEPDRAPGGRLGEVYLAMIAVRDGNLAAVDRFAGAIEQAGCADAEPLMQLGIGLSQAGRFDEAAIIFRRIIESDPDLVPAHINLALALMRLGEPAGALEHLRSALKFEPDSPEAHHHLAFLLSRLASPEQAAVHYERAIATRPIDAETRFHYGNLLGRLHRIEEASAQFRAVLAIDPDHADGYENLGVALRRLGRWSDALHTWEEGARVAPDDAGIVHELALTRLHSPDESQRDAAAAVRWSRRLIALAPASAEAAMIHAAALLDSTDAETPTAVAAISDARARGGDPWACAVLTAFAERRSIAGPRGAAAPASDSARGTDAAPGRTLDPRLVAWLRETEAELTRQ